ncbi:MAG: transcriptional regulator [Gammaproteobacteria bacterium TMED186]|nr:MAG: transcriptional regulator [Gammaproteobacteria bacterium TMED186]
MSYTKSDIAKNIAIKTSISNQSAKQLLDKFIQVVVSASSKSQVKISGFGTFVRKKTPSRIGRNPKTGEEFGISERSKLNLILSNKIKEKIN